MLRIVLGVSTLGALLVTYWVHPTTAWIVLGSSFTLALAFSMVGSTPVAKYIYSRASANGKRAQCQAGAKNPIIVMPDADMEMAVRISADSYFGCAGQRCLAASLAVTVGTSGMASHSTVAACGQLSNVGAVVSTTVMTCVQTAVLPHSSAAVQLRVSV